MNPNQWTPRRPLPDWERNYRHGSIQPMHEPNWLDRLLGIGRTTQTKGDKR